VGSPRNTPKISNLSVIACTQRPYSVHTTFPQRLYSVHDVFTARKQLLQRVHSAQTARSWCAHSVLSAIIAFKIVYLFYFLFWVILFCKHSDLFLLFQASRHRILQLWQLLKCFKSGRTCNICSNIHTLSSVHWIAFIMMCFSWVYFLHSVAGVCTARTSAFCNLLNAVWTL